MKNIILLLLSFSIISCELHDQEVFLKGNETKSVFELETIEKMFSAVSSNDYFGLKELIEAQEMDLNIQNKQGQLLLNEALKLEKDLIVTLLLENGANPEELDKEEISARDIIKTLSSPEVWELILDGQTPGQDFLDQKVIQLVTEAAEDQQEAVIKKLGLYFESGANVNARNRRKYTLLIIASSKGLDNLVTYLCETDGVDINAKVGRYTALSLTKRLARRNPELKSVIEILLAHGAQ
jgi:ankyrin repeat protein